MGTYFEGVNEDGNTVAGFITGKAAELSSGDIIIKSQANLDGKKDKNNDDEILEVAFANSISTEFESIDLGDRTQLTVGADISQVANLKGNNQVDGASNQDISNTSTVSAAAELNHRVSNNMAVSLNAETTNSEVTDLATGQTDPTIGQSYSGSVLLETNRRDLSVETTAYKKYQDGATTDGVSIQGTYRKGNTVITGKFDSSDTKGGPETINGRTISAAVQVRRNFKTKKGNEVATLLKAFHSQRESLTSHGIQVGVESGKHSVNLSYRKDLEERGHSDYEKDTVSIGYKYQIFEKCSVEIGFSRCEDNNGYTTDTSHILFTLGNR